MYIYLYVDIMNRCIPGVFCYRTIYKKTAGCGAIDAALYNAAITACGKVGSLSWLMWLDDSNPKKPMGKPLEKWKNHRKTMGK